jgi:hypothetical protein
MTASRWFFGVVLCGGLAACGGSAADAGAAHDAPGCSSAPHCGSCQGCYDACICEGATSGSCVAKCATGSGGSGAGGGGGTGGSPTAAETVTIKTTPYTVEAGSEAYFCQNFANPFGKDVEVVSSESFMTPGSHHMFVFYAPGATDGPSEKCSGLEYEKTLHSAQTPQQLITYPPDVGASVPATDGLRILAHFLNTGQQAISAELTVVFKVVPAGTVKMQAAALFFNNFNVNVPPLGTGQATKTCSIPYDAQLITVVSHMHQFGTHFLAKESDGTVVYEGSAWDDPVPAVFDPPLLLPGGSSITYSCDYENTTTQTLTFGESAKTNEMCILSGQYFPAPNGKSIVCF